MNILHRIVIVTTASLLAMPPACPQKPLEIEIWPDGLPNSNGTDITEPYNDSTRNYKPTMYVYLPDSGNTGCAVLSLPGGGYSNISLDNEGHSWARPLNEKGIALIVVKYRLPRNRMLAVPETDVYEAIRITRRHAKEWGIDLHKVGVMGFSAGGHLASTVATHAKEDARPDFQILFYPVISMRNDMRTPQSGTKPNFMGLDAPPEIETYYSNEKQVTAATPPALIFTVDDDTLVPTRNSTEYYFALRHAGVPASLHIYPSGGHGFGGKKNFPFRRQMLNTLFAWLSSLEQKLPQQDT